MAWWLAWISMVRWRRVVVTNRLVLQPVVWSIQRDTARAANTMLRCAWVDLRVWWWIGRAARSVLDIRNDFSTCNSRL